MTVRDGDNAPSTRKLLLYAALLIAFIVTLYIVLVVIGDENDEAGRTGRVVSVEPWLVCVQPTGTRDRMCLDMTTPSPAVEVGECIQLDRNDPTVSDEWLVPCPHGLYET